MAADALTEGQKNEVEDVVRNLLTKKEPEIFIKAAQAIQDKQQAEVIQKSAKAVALNKGKIFNDPTSPVSGNPKGDIVVVEFYDYECGYCKMMQEPIRKLLAEDKNVTFIYKEFPVLGDNSVLAAKASLASFRQGLTKFLKYHEALLSLKEHLSGKGRSARDILLQTAKDAGLDVEKLKKDMDDEAVAKQIEANVTLGADIGARGTPSFVIGDQLYPGAMPYEGLKKAVDDARKDKKEKK